MKNSLLAKLLNDESFIRWIKGCASEKESKRWDRWLLEDPKHRDIAKKAKKFITIPFTDDTPTDIQKELQILKEKLNTFSKEKG